MNLTSNAALDLTKLPPMLCQYLDYKSKYPDCLLFFQVGDFYELFFEDAIKVAKHLNLTLTSRDKSSPEPVPMAGVPISVIDGYLERLVDAGFSVAVVSQISSGSESSKVISRRLERIITPGIRLLSGNEQGKSGSSVASVSYSKDNQMSLAFSDVQSGKIFVREGLDLNQLYAELSRIMPSELVLPRVIEGQLLDRRSTWVREAARVVPVDAIKFRGELQSDSSPDGIRYATIKGFTSLAMLSRRAVRLLVSYIDEVTVERALPLREVQIRTYENAMTIDATTRANLEIVRNCKDGSRAGTLLSVLDRTSSVAGERLLQHWLLNPLLEVAEIQRRQSAVAYLKQKSPLRKDLAKLLKTVPDLSRIAARIEIAIANPRELGAVRDICCELPSLRQLLNSPELQGPQPASEFLSAIYSNLVAPSALVDMLASELVDSPPLSVNEGGIIREHVNPEIDRLRNLKNSGRSWIAELEAEERKNSGINSLKIKFNNVLGFFIEITQANVSKVPSHFIRRQSTANTERFTTVELKARESEVLGAESKQIELEKKLFENLRDRCREWVSELRALGENLSILDVLNSLAEVADCENYCAPQVDQSLDLEIEDGKHPVLAPLLQTRFVANSLELKENDKNFMVITGPNMGGKSTFLRQAGLITILAHIGSYVPAKKARVGIVDKLFARLGASDNMLEGESTFMLEMREASHIVSAASQRSLILVDEIGRGTATADGLAVAQSILEWIVQKTGARTLFATHYHELTALESHIPQVGNLSVGSFEQGEDVIFTHEIKPGSASRSYGLEVAKLAGLPSEIIQRARAILSQSEQNSPGASTRGKVSFLETRRVADKQRISSPQLALFERVEERPAKVVEPTDYKELCQLREELRSVSTDSITPLQALNLLDQIKQKVLQTRSLATKT